MQKKVIAIVGSTGSGKSTLGAFLAHKLRGTVISADSRQIYKGMRVISRAEPGAMVGIANPRHPYSAGRYAKEAAKALRKVAVPIVVGGAGFYADALLRAPLPEVAPNKKLRSRLAKKTSAELLALLQKLDPARAQQVDSHNNVRLVRAIEIATKLGKVPSRQGVSTHNTLWLGLSAPKHYERVLKRGVQERLQRGMAAEARRLRAALPKKRYAELGFEFDLLSSYLDKKITKEDLVDALVRGELRYAKRQMRWFKRHKDIRWVKNKTDALRLAKSFLSS